MNKNTNSQDVLFEAIEFANWAHRDQKRKLGNTPYIMHPFHVTLLLLSHGVKADESEGLIILLAGALHDTLEDNPAEVTFDLIEEKFGNEVARVVNGVTLDPNNPDKRLSRQKILKSDWMTRIVKVADILSNTIAITNLIRKFGFEDVQKCFKQPIPERIEMERAFLKDVCRHHDYQSLVGIRESTVKALEELEIVSKL